MTSKYIGSRSSLPKIATFGPPRAEKLIFSDKTLACSNDCAPKHICKCLLTTIVSDPAILLFDLIYIVTRCPNQLLLLFRKSIERCL